MLKPLTVWITTNCGKLLKRWDYQTTLPASWETYMQGKKQQLEPDMEPVWFQIGKEVHQGCISSPCLFKLYAEYIWETLGWMKHKLESRLLGDISITSDMQMIPPLRQKSEEELKSFLMKVKEESEKVGLQLSIQITKSSWQIVGETMEAVIDFIFGGSKITAVGDCSHEIKRRLLLGRKVVTLHIKMQRHYFASKGLSCQSYGFSSGHVWMWDLDYKESWALENWWFWTVVLGKTPESPLDCKEILPVHPKGNQSWMFIGRTDAEAETPIL